MYHPSRGGVRGGADQFEWESVKSDKHRENYLGHSLMAPVGRWQKNKDLQWFSRDKKGASSSKEAEREAIRRMEADAMAAALGHAPVKRAATSQLTKQELEEAFRKGQTERDDKDIERIEGMGFGSTRASLMDSGSTKETMSAVGSQEYSKKENRTADQTNTETKESRRERKKEKKEKRKKKKRKSKSAKRSKRHDSPSDSEDSGRNSKRDYDRDRHRRRHSDDDDGDDDDDDNPKSKSKRTRHDSTSDSESESRIVRKSDLKAKVSKRRHDSTSDDEPRSKMKQSSYRNKTKRRYDRKYDRKELRRQRHGSYSD